MTVLPGGLAEALASEEHERSAAERSFRRRLGPLLELAAANPDATDLYVDQGRIRLSFGRERVPYTYGQLGRGTFGKSEVKPRIVTGLSDVTALAPHLIRAHAARPAE